VASILLIRHGPVALQAPGLLSFADFAAFIAAYEGSGIAPDAQPPAELVRLARGAARLFASDARRVSETLARLGVTADVTDAAFREAPPLAPRLPGRWPEIVWLALARARGEFDPALAPARADLRARAAACCNQLRESRAGGDMALVGHGWFNRAVARSLQAQGWRKTGGEGFARPWGHVALSEL
jgi:broad specificity phosphatase PhoE